MKSRKTNALIAGLIDALKALSYEKQAGIWRELSVRLSKGTRRMATVNVGEISARTEPKDQIAVPGKVLGFGSLDHPVIVASVGFSAAARQKIVAAGGECMGLLDLATRNPKGSNVKIMV